MARPPERCRSLPLTSRQAASWNTAQASLGHAADAPCEDRWDLIDYLRAHNTGEFVRTAGRGLQPLRIPGFSVACADCRTLDLDDLRGHVLRLVMSPGNKPILASAEASRQLTTVIMPAISTGGAGEVGCVAQHEAREAFAILLGTTPDALAGTQLLIDPNDWLRARWHPGEPGGWATPELLSARIRALAEHSLPPS